MTSFSQSGYLKFGSDRSAKRIDLGRWGGSFTPAAANGTVWRNSGPFTELIVDKLRKDKAQHSYQGGKPIVPNPRQSPQTPYSSCSPGSRPRRST